MKVNSNILLTIAFSILATVYFITYLVEGEVELFGLICLIIANQFVILDKLENRPK